jgi:hypothetical protein
MWFYASPKPLFCGPAIGHGDSWQVEANVLKHLSTPRLVKSTRQALELPINALWQSNGHLHNSLCQRMTALLSIAWVLTEEA